MKNNKTVAVPPFLIKVGKKDHLLSLQNEGQIYFGTFSGYRRMDNKEIRRLLRCLLNQEPVNLIKYDSYRTDPHEGLEFRMKANVSAKLTTPPFQNISFNDPKGNINVYQNRYTHLYCLYHIPRYLNENFKIDMGMTLFGEYALIITKPKIFLERLMAKMEQPFDMDYVNYYSEEKEIYSVFDKRERFSYQNEFRIVTNIKEGNFIHIGNIKDITVLVKSSKLQSFEYEIEPFLNDKTSNLSQK